eukprot:TRINITY_DN11794_c0_g1_i4.p1 TRINITY_DN11794_c0_g1~~TRINITY_DN11794_c0_g1_i4.p1  ORF type:complete len:606 (+),score=158.65 TRINITY_DN11794_c0_g1_i4:259-2076(+)
MSKSSAAFAETCRILFNAADEDGNASLDPEEFRAVLQSDALGLKLTPDELDEVIENADQDGDGTITLDEFIPVVEKLFYRSPATAKASTRSARRQRHLGYSPHSRQRSTPSTPAAARNANTPRTGSSKWGLLRRCVNNKAVNLTQTVKTLDFASAAIMAMRRGSKLQETDVYQVRKHGIEALRKGNYETAEELLQCAVSLARRFRGRNELQLSLSYYGLGQTLARLGKRQEAVQAFKGALKIRLKLYSNNHHSVLECRMHLVQLQSALGYYQEAEEHGWAVYSSDTAKDRYQLDALWLTFLGSFAHALHKQRKTASAHKVLLTLTTTITKHMDRQTKDINNVLSSLGFLSEVLDGEGSLAMEKQFREEAATMLQSGSQEEYRNSLLHGNTMYSLARMLLQQGNHADAEPLIEQALAIFEKVHGPNHPRIAFTLTTLASCYTVQPSARKHKRAVSMLERAITLMQASFGEHALEQAETGGPLPVRAKLEEMLSDLPQARRTWATVLQMREDAYGKGDSRTVLARNEHDRIASVIAEQRAPRTVAALMRLQEERRAKLAQSCQDCHEMLPVTTDEPTTPKPSHCDKCMVYHKVAERERCKLGFGRAV